MLSDGAGRQDGMQPARRPLVARERAMWLLYEYVPDSGVLNVAFAIEPAHGRMDLAALREAVAAIGRRHPALRSGCLVIDGEPMHVPRPPDDPAGADVVVVREIGIAELAEELQRAAAVRLDLATDWPIRVTVLRTPDRDVVCVTVHHLVYDAYSARVLYRDLERAYTGLSTDGALPAELHRPVIGPPPEDGSAASVRYWRDVLSDARPSTDLDLGRQSARAPGFPGAAFRSTAQPQAWQAARALARRTSCPVSAVALAAFATVLFRHGAGTDLVFGVPTYNRGRPAHEAIGYYMCVEPVRIRFAADTGFAELIKQCARQMLEGLQYADASIDEVRAEGYEAVGAEQRPLVRYLFNYLADLPEEPAGDLWQDYLLDATHSRLDLDLAFIRAGDGVVFRAIYASDLFQAEHIAALIARMQQVMLAAAAAPDTAVATLELATEADRQLLDGSCEPAAADCGGLAAERDVLEDVATSAFADPAAPAVGPGPGGPPALDFGTLVASADALGAELRAAELSGADLGLPSGAPVRVAADSLADTCLAVLGCWSAGHPARLGAADSDSGAADSDAADSDAADSGAADSDAAGMRWLVRSPGAPPAAAEIVLNRVADDATVLFDRPPPDDTALVYDDPSHGGPVKLTHAAVAEAVGTLATALSLGPSDVVAIARRGDTAETLIDALAALSLGAQVIEVPATDEAVAAAAATATVLVASPLLIARLLDAPAGTLAVTRAAVRGGMLPPGIAARAATAGLALIRLLGPLAPDGATTASRLTGAEPPGYLAGPDRARVVDAAGEQALPFVRGRLQVAGRLAPPAMPVQLTPAGIEYLADEATAPALHAVLADPRIRYAAVRTGEPATVLAEAREPVPADFADRIEARFGVAVSVHDAPLPIDADGEPDLAVAEPDPVAPAEPAASPEIDGVDVVALWCQVLGRSDIGPDDNFFAVGGDSLKAARVLGQLKKRTGRKVSLRTAFKFPTPAGFAAAVSASS
jgi:acyl carrier protein